MHSANCVDQPCHRTKGNVIYDRGHILSPEGVLIVHNVLDSVQNVCHATRIKGSVIYDLRYIQSPEGVLMEQAVLHQPCCRTVETPEVGHAAGSKLLVH